MTEEALKEAAEAFVRKWQARLRLDGWDIRVKVESTPPDAIGQSDHHWRLGRSVITIPPDHDRRARDDGRGFMDDDSEEHLLEDTVLHELLHIADQPLRGEFRDGFMRWFGEGSQLGDDLWKTFEGLEEWRINRVVQALLAADRGGWGSDAAA